MEKKKKASLFTAAEKWKQPKPLLPDEKVLEVNGGDGCTTM